MISYYTGVWRVFQLIEVGYRQSFEKGHACSVALVWSRPLKASEPKALNSPVQGSKSDTTVLPTQKSW